MYILTNREPQQMEKKEHGRNIGNTKNSSKLIISLACYKKLSNKKETFRN